MSEDHCSAISGRMSEDARVTRAREVSDGRYVGHGMDTIRDLLAAYDEMEDAIAYAWSYADGFEREAIAATVRAGNLEHELRAVTGFIANHDQQERAKAYRVGYGDARRERDCDPGLALDGGGDD